MTRERVVYELENSIKLGISISREAREWLFDYLDQEPTTKNDLGVDCISRADAIKGLGEQPYVWTDSDYEIQQLEDWKAHKEMLENLPSVTPQEPRKGHWIKYDATYFTAEKLTSVIHSIRECSECHTKIADFCGEMKYCPNCGCRMVEPQESEDKE